MNEGFVVSARLEGNVMKENRSNLARSERDFTLMQRIQMKIGNLLGSRDRPEIGRSRVYRGTVDAAKIRKRRAKNKVARKQRVYNARRGRK